MDNRGTNLRLLDMDGADMDPRYAIKGHELRDGDHVTVCVQEVVDRNPSDVTRVVYPVTVRFART